MKNQSKFAAVALLSVATLFAACGEKKPSIAEQQLQVCTKIIQDSLQDPNSFELLSATSYTLDSGWHRVVVEFTAKNGFGGRVRSPKQMCGFVSKDSAELNFEDFVTRDRYRLANKPIPNTK